ncbi:leucine-rich repeat domain-containing protein [Brachyspira hyodysenteriae]|uniref:leucine-rich repeat domain-containing protein n=1 Tax=Brachyspira hyodysenteriae TaxID=159 RepID=UPI0022CDF000|nr:leucine-rich repeat domain-containing protein [Brachyspira hyodysenteriae]MDA0024366.1 leucine-rich repeat domain-containing protein [Brachyspira hyodysenteriae]
MFIKLKLLLLLILLISCNNYKVTDPFSLDESYGSSNIPVSNIPENVDSKYFIKSDYKEDKIESIMQEYFNEYNCYIIFLKDTKDNIDNNNIISTINAIIKKDKYLKGVSLDLSRTDMTKLADNSFTDNKNLIHVKLPNTITTIGVSAFSGCLVLKTINFPSSITEISQEAFKSCRSLYLADISKTKITIVNNGIFNDCASLITIILPETIIDGINSKAFYDCASLKTINIPSKTKIIGDAVFYNCKSLASIKLNASITGMGDRVFSGCVALKNIEYAGNKSSDITSVGIDIFDAQLTAKNLYLPNVASDDGSWNNFLGYDWKNKGSIIFGKSMPN